MKKAFICILILILSILLCSCSQNVVFDRYNGYRYALESETGGDISIRLDANGSGQVTELYIFAICNELLSDTDPSWNTSYLTQDKYPISYYKSGEKGEQIILKLYRDDFDLKKAQKLIDYIGLTSELKDGKLKYEEELLKSDTFKYAYIIKDGEKHNLNESNPFRSE